MSEEIVQGVIETIDSANKHRLQLSELQESLEEAKAQINESATYSEKLLKIHFDELKEEIKNALDTRMAELINQIRTTQTECLDPLLQCEEIIKSGIDASASILKDGKELLMGDHDANEANMKSFVKRSNECGDHNLPDVPGLSEVACIVLDLPESGCEGLVDFLDDYGRVMPRAPVQIVEVAERPGGLMLKWAEAEEETSLGLSEFRLQYCSGAVTIKELNENKFQDVYQGNLMSHTMRHLSTKTMYSFRVCGRAEGADTWSPWSIPLQASTSVPHYEWKQGTKGYELSNKHSIAFSCKSDGDKEVLYSSSKSYTCGHSLVLKVLEDGGTTESMDGICLRTSDKAADSFLSKGTLFVSTEGAVYHDGNEKLTRLPALRQGSVVTFDTEVLQADKVRVTVEVDDKILTFDWIIEKEAGANEGLNPMSFGMSGNTVQANPMLFFAIKFENPGWKIAVE